MANILHRHVSPGFCSQLMQTYRLSALISLQHRNHPMSRSHLQPACNAPVFSHRFISTASQTDYLSLSSIDTNWVSSSGELSPTGFLDKLDEQALRTCSPNLIAQCLLQLNKHYFKHLQTSLPWLLSHHHEIYKQLHQSGKLQEVSTTIRNHPKFIHMYKRLEQAYHDCNDQELTLSLLSLLYLGVSPQDLLVHSLLFEIRERLPSMKIQTLTIVSWLCKTLPEHDFITGSACVQKLAAAVTHAGSLSVDDIHNLCIQEMNHKHLLSSEATLKLCTILLNQAEGGTFFRNPQHLAAVAAFFTRNTIMYHLKKHDLLSKFELWMEYFKEACKDLVDEMTEDHISHVCQFLKFTEQYSTKIRMQFEKQSLKLLAGEPSIGKLAKLLCALSPATSRDVLWPFEERLFHQLSDADDEVVCLLAQNIIGARCDAFSTETLMKVEDLLASRCSRFLTDYDQIKDIILFLGKRNFMDGESGMQFFEVLLRNIIESPTSNPNINALASCYLMTKAEFPESANAIFTPVESAILRSDESCALDMFRFLNSASRDCKNSLRTVEGYVHARLLQAVTDSSDLFHLCFIVQNMVNIEESFKFRDEKLSKAIMKRLGELLSETGIKISESVFLSVIDILRVMKCYEPNILDRLVCYYSDNKKLQTEKITIKLLCTLSIYSHRSEMFENMIPSVIKLINTKLKCQKYKDVMLLLNYLMRIQVYLEDEIRQLFSFEFLTELGPESGYMEEPARIILVELTRRCLLEHPELDIPWFHDEYCRTHIVTAEPKNYLTFRDGVAAALRHVLGGENYFLRWTYTPYFYPVDFECILDESVKPVNVKQLSSADLQDRWQRVAIVLHTQSCYWLHSDNLRGSIRDRNHHLEIMGYKVIPINYKEWFSELVTNEQRVNYLRDHILR